MRQDDDLTERLTLTAKDLERLTGIKAGTYLYWAWRDQDRDDKLGPPSFTAGRRRLWMRDAFMQWLDDGQNKAV